MREIEFRAWDIKQGKWRNDLLINFLGYLRIGYMSETRLVMPDDADNFVIQQFTGLKDKNGKEIYEGDVVRDISDKSVGRVSWNTSWMKWDVGADGKWAEDSAYVRSYIEVIGNIYENPELLK